MKAALQLIFAALVAQLASAEHTRLIAEPGNGERIPVDLTVTGHVVVAISGQPIPPQPFYKPSINMYDFDAKIEARKVVDDEVCFIKVLDKDFTDFEKFFNGLKLTENHITSDVYEELNVAGTEITPEELEETVGANVAEFCSDYPVYWLINSGKLQRTVTNRVKRQSKNKWKVDLKLDYNKKDGFKVSAGVSFSF